LAKDRIADLDPYLTRGSTDARRPLTKRHLDRFSRFYTAHPCAQHTDRQTTLRATSVATGHICALRACDFGLKPIRFDNGDPDRIYGAESGLRVLDF